MGATPDEKTFQQLSLSWGVYPVRSLRQNSTEELCRHVVDCARNADVIDEGDLVVITAGEPAGCKQGHDAAARAECIKALKGRWLPALPPRGRHFLIRSRGTTRRFSIDKSRRAIYNI